MRSAITLALTELGCTPDAADRIAAHTIHGYLGGETAPADDLADLDLVTRGVAGEIMFCLAALSREAGVANPNLGPAADHAAAALRTALRTIAEATSGNR